MSVYISYSFIVFPKEPATEILIAELAYSSFESFIETKNGMTAYIQKKDWHEDILQGIQILNSDEFKISYESAEVDQINWNSEWEKNFEAIQVNDQISVRAPFHADPKLKYDIIIEPKMSFGTGHHETTHLMLQQLLDLDVGGRSVLDMGCGTGILAIFAEMKGADKIDAIDIDTWCYENSIENIEKNHCNNIAVYQGDASLLKKKSYDLIIANINRNVLLQDIAVYSRNLTKKGVLLLSGFYKEDIPIIDKEAQRYNLYLEKTLEKNNWVSLKYVN